MKKIIVLILLVIIYNISFSQNFRQNILISKFSGHLSKSKVQKILSTYGVTNIKKVFSNLDYSIPAAYKLDKYYYLYMNSNKNLNQIKEKIAKISWIESVEYDYINEALYIPNDPKYNIQKFLPQIMADMAWDYAKGDKTIVIAIIDTGVDWNHIDLMENIWNNQNEIADNNNDDDNNGYIDDIRGWDFVNLTQSDINSYTNQGYKLRNNEDYQKEDNDPSDVEGHGTHCAGLSSAISDNNTGIASVGFNCTIMPLRIGFSIINKNGSPTGQGYSSYMAKAFVYAANNGADVINLSFGNSGQMIKDAAEYCYEKGVAVFVAAGNDNTSEDHSALTNCQYAFTVAAVALDDRKAYYSNFGSWVEISAPGGDYNNGGQLLSTIPNNSYAYMQGTSMATPVAVGAYALLKSYYKNLSMQELIKRLFFTSDDIYNINPDYIGQLGYGRINIYKAITTPKHPYFEGCTISTENNTGNNFFTPGDTANIYLTLSNSWGSADNFNFKISSNDPFIHFINNSFSENIPENSTFKTNNSFRFYIDSLSTFHTAKIDILLYDSLYTKSYSFDLELGIPDIIIINDSTNEKELNFIKKILEKNSYTFKIFDKQQLNDSISLYNNLLKNTDLLIYMINNNKDYMDESTLNFITALSELNYNILIDGKLITSSLNSDENAKQIYNQLFNLTCKNDFIPEKELIGTEENPFSSGLNFTIDNVILSSLSLNENNTPLFIYNEQDSVGCITTLQNGTSLIMPGFYFTNIIDSAKAEQFIINIVSFTAKGFYIEHTPIQIVEDSSKNIPINVVLHNFDTYDVNILLYWKLQDDSQFNIVQLIQQNNIYSGIIPAPMTDTILNYYIYAENKKDNIILPYDFPNLYNLYIGDDTTAPEVSAFLYPPYVLRRNDFNFYIKACDNLGIDTTKSIMKYKIGSNDLAEIKLSHIEGNTYNVFLHLDEEMQMNKWFIYWFEIYDKSKKSNKKKIPVSSIYKFKVSDSIPFGTFEDEIYRNLWSLEGDWGILNKYAYEGSYIIRYPEEGVYKNNRNESATFNFPIDLRNSDKLYLTMYTKWVFSSKTNGDSGIVEISTDNKKTWHILTTFTGRNTSFHPEWVDLAPYCTEDADSIYIRLRCHTDYEGISGGWFVDNMYIAPTHPTNIKEKSNKNNIKNTELFQNYPNPFNLTTIISYSIDQPTNVKLEIFNILGRHIKTLINKKQSSGKYKIKWDGKDKNNNIVANGIYFYKLKTNNSERIKKMILLK